MSANRDGPLVKVRDLRKSFGQNQVLRGVDLDVARGEVVSVIGSSGSGKTTMLRCVNLLETYDSGSITVDGVEVGYSGEGPARRRRGERELARVRADIGMVFQLFNLFPHLTARENVMLGLRKVRRLSKGEAGDIADRWLARVGLAAKRESLPYELSGGQQQRVGIARAVAMNPKVLLLDEITSALDPELVGEVLKRGARTRGRGHDDDPGHARNELRPRCFRARGVHGCRPGRGPGHATRSLQRAASRAAARFSLAH